MNYKDLYGRLILYCVSSRSISVVALLRNLKLLNFARFLRWRSDTQGTEMWWRLHVYI